MGSPDNVLLGFDFNWILSQRLSFYGQFILDELSVDRLFDGSNWWGNKYGFQVGVEYFNALGVEGMDLQAEYNHIRPYTYAHRDTFANYSHFNQSLAHPFGANLKEGIFRIKYLKKKWLLEWTHYLSLYGEDPEGENYGKNILLANEARPMDTGVVIGQGIRTEIYRMEFLLSYMLFHNGFIDLHGGYRSASAEGSVEDSGYLGLGFRINIGLQRLPF